MQILIAEDEEATAKALKLLLEKAMYSVDIITIRRPIQRGFLTGSTGRTIPETRKRAAAGSGWPSQRRSRKATAGPFQPALRARKR